MDSCIMIKKILLGTVCLAAAFSCSKETGENPASPTEKYSGISVEDNGFSFPDTTIATSFVAGDEIGVFAVKDGAVLDSIDNLRLTLGDSGWIADGDVSFVEGDGIVYYAYFPFSESLSGNIDPSASDENGFFAEVAANWDTPMDQGDSLIFGGADLMTAQGHSEGDVLHFGMNHRMYLVVVDLPGTKYTFTNEPAIPDYFVGGGNAGFDGFTPFQWEDGTYRFLVNPALPQMTIGGYYGSENNPNTWEMDVDAKAGEGYLLKIDGGGRVIEHELMAGDFFLADGNILPKDSDEAIVGASDVIGIVFQTDPERIGDAEKNALGGKLHALVVATKTVQQNNYFAWYSNGDIYERDETEIGFMNSYSDDPYEAFSLSDMDINGFLNTSAIRQYRTEDYESGYYGAFKAAVDFESEAGGPSPEIATTGWYLPTAGQFFDIIRNLAGVTLDDGDGFVGYSLASFAWENKGDVILSLNEAMGAVAEDDKVEFKSSGYYWTASSTLDGEARYIGLVYGGTNVTCVSTYKYDILFVRPVLAF